MPKFERLRQSHPSLAKLFKLYWDTPLQDYAALLYQSTSPQVDPLFLEVFQQELEEQQYSKEEAEAARKQIQNNPVLQTSHHITATHGPTFCTLDLQCLSGLKEEETYLIGANSGVAFSNSAWSGALSYENLPLETLIQKDTALFKKSSKAQTERQNHGEKEERVSLIPAKLRDQLLYGEKIPSSVTEAYHQLSPELQSLLWKPVEGKSYTDFAIHSAKKIQEKIFARKFVIFDINQTASSYLVQLTEKQPAHPLIQFLNSPESIEKLTTLSGEKMTFLGSYQGKKSKKIEKFTFNGTSLEGEKTTKHNCSWAELISKLKRKELCIGLLPLFLTLSFSLGIKCLGSFKQIEYLTQIHWALDQMNLSWGAALQKSPSLTTGRVTQTEQELQSFMPLTLALQKQSILTDHFAKQPMGFFWQYYLTKLDDES